MLFTLAGNDDQPPPIRTALSPADQAEECSQLKTAYQVCRDLGVPTLPVLIRLHEIEDGY